MKIAQFLFILFFAIIFDQIAADGGKNIGEIINKPKIIGEKKIDDNKNLQRKIIQKWIRQARRRKAKKGEMERKVVEPLKPEDELKLCKQIKSLEEQIGNKKELLKIQQNELNKIIGSKILLGIFKVEERKQICTFLGWKIFKEKLENEKIKSEKEFEEKLKKFEENYEKETKGPIEDLMKRREEIWRKFEGEKMELKSDYERKKLEANEIYEKGRKNLEKKYLEWEERKKGEFKKEIAKLEFGETKRELNEKWAELEGEYAKKFGKKEGGKSFWKKGRIGKKKGEKGTKKKGKEIYPKPVPKIALKCVLSEMEDQNEDEAKNAKKLAKLMELVGEEERVIRAEMGGTKSTWQVGKAIQAVRAGIYLMKIAKGKEGKVGEGKLKKMVEMLKEEEEKKMKDLGEEEEESDNSTIFTDSDGSRSSKSSKSSKSSFSSSSSFSSQNSFNQQNSFGSEGMGSSGDDLELDSMEILEPEEIIEDQMENEIKNSPELLKKFKELKKCIGELEEKKEKGRKIQKEFGKLKEEKWEKNWRKMGKLAKITKAAHFHAYLEFAIEMEEKMVGVRKKLENLYKNEKLYSANENEPKMSPEKFLEKVGTKLTDECERAKTQMEWAVGDIGKKLGQMAKLERNLEEMEKIKGEMEKMEGKKDGLGKLLGEKVEEKCEELIEYSEFEDAEGEQMEEGWEFGGR